MFNYFYKQENENFLFLQLPMALIKEECFKPLSDSAKILYSLLLNRTSLSRKNNWYDNEGKLYIIYTTKEIQADLNCGEQKALKNMNDLRKIGLVRTIRRGLTMPNIIYVMNFTTDLKYKKPSPKSENESINSETLLSNENHSSENYDSENILNNENHSSKTESNIAQQHLKSATIYTNPINTDKNNKNKRIYNRETTTSYPILSYPVIENDEKKDRKNDTIKNDNNYFEERENFKNDFGKDKKNDAIKNNNNSFQERENFKNDFGKDKKNDTVRNDNNIQERENFKNDFGKEKINDAARNDNNYIQERENLKKDEKKESLKNATSAREKHSNKLSINRYDYNIVKEQILDQIDYNIMIFDDKHNKRLIDEIVDVIVNTICNNWKSNTISMGEETVSAEVVRSVFFKLNRFHIDYFIDCYASQTNTIVKIDAYIRASLFRNFGTINHHYDNKFSVDRLKY